MLLVRRYVRLSVGQRRARVVGIVADGIAADGTVEVEIGVDGMAGEGTRLRVRLRVDASRVGVSPLGKVDGIRGWIRSASGLPLGVLGRLRLMMSLWI